MKYLIIMSMLLLTSCNEFGSGPTCKADQVTVGMSEADLLKLCGSVERSYSSSGKTQWAYLGPERLFVYTENGKVDSKQWTAYK